MDMLRVWPIVIEYGFGAVLCAVGIWCGISSGYLDLKIAANRRLIAIVIGGYIALLLLVCFFTFVAPFWGGEVHP